MEKTSLFLSDFSDIATPNVFQLCELIRFFHITLHIYYHNLRRKATKYGILATKYGTLGIFSMYVCYV